MHSSTHFKYNLHCPEPNNFHTVTLANTNLFYWHENTKLSWFAFLRPKQRPTSDLWLSERCSFHTVIMIWRLFFFFLIFCLFQHYLMIAMLDKNFSRHFKIFPLLFHENRICPFMQNCLWNKQNISKCWFIDLMPCMYVNLLHLTFGLLNLKISRQHLETFSLKDTWQRIQQTICMKSPYLLRGSR